MFGLVFDKAKGANDHVMANPRAIQRREPLGRIFEPIPDRFARHFPMRIARGDFLPIMGQVQAMPDGSPGGRPIPQPETLMSPLARSSMERKGFQIANRDRNHKERTIQAKRFLAKERITLLQLNKPSAREAATSLRWKPGNIDKPAPPVPYQGGFSRVFERNIAFPKDTTLSMQPISTVDTRWARMPLPTSSGAFSGVAARFPKTL